MADEQPNDPLTIQWELDLQPNGNLAFFETLNEVKEWVEAEIEFWSFLNEKPRTSSFFQQVSSLKQDCNQAIGNPQHPNFKNELKQHILQFYAQNRNLIHSGQTIATYIKDIWATDKNLAGLCLEYATSRKFNPQQGEAAHAAFLVELQQAGLDPDQGMENIRQSLQEVHTRFANLAAESAKAEPERNRGYEDWKNRSEQQLRDQEAQYRAILRRAVAKGKREIADSKARIKELEAFYEKGLALQAPIKYWRNKSRWHMAGVIGFTVATILAFCAGAWWINQAVIDSGLGTTKLSEVTLGKISMVGLVAVFGIWAIRILVRMLLSNAHLFNDARERMVMINAYLALLESDQLPEKSKELILQSIFRPTATGIVKDDAAPPFMAQWIKHTTGTDL